jgi:GntR family transcriptional regulator, rspAB operon transcriptional repressor
LRIDRKNLLDQTVEAIRDDILRGVLSPGERLTELSLAESLGSRRSTLRAALLELEKEGFVTRSRYSSWSVSSLSEKEIWEVYSFRGALEGLAARTLANGITQEKRDVLSTAYEVMRAAEDTGTESSRVEADLHFHHTIVRLSDHALLLSQYDILRHKVEWIYRWSERQSPRRIQLPGWHQPLFKAILAGDAAAAEAAIQALTKASYEDDIADLKGRARHKAGRDGKMA